MTTDNILDALYTIDKRRSRKRSEARIYIALGIIVILEMILILFAAPVLLQF